MHSPFASGFGPEHNWFSTPLGGEPSTPPQAPATALASALAGGNRLLDYIGFNYGGDGGVESGLAKQMEWDNIAREETRQMNKEMGFPSEDDSVSRAMRGFLDRTVGRISPAQVAAFPTPLPFKAIVGIMDYLTRKEPMVEEWGPDVALKNQQALEKSKEAWKDAELAESGIVGTQPKRSMDISPDLYDPDNLNSPPPAPHVPTPSWGWSPLDMGLPTRDLRQTDMIDATGRGYGSALEAGLGGGAKGDQLRGPPATGLGWNIGPMNVFGQMPGQPITGLVDPRGPAGGLAMPGFGNFVREEPPQPITWDPGAFSPPPSPMTPAQIAFENAVMGELFGGGSGGFDFGWSNMGGDHGSGGDPGPGGMGDVGSATI